MTVGNLVKIKNKSAWNKHMEIGWHGKLRLRMNSHNNVFLVLGDFDAPYGVSQHYCFHLLRLIDGETFLWSYDNGEAERIKNSLLPV